MNKENCALKLVDEIILYYDARSKKHQKHQIAYIVYMYVGGKLTIYSTCLGMTYQVDNSILTNIAYDPTASIFSVELAGFGKTNNDRQCVCVCVCVT